MLHSFKNKCYLHFIKSIWKIIIKTSIFMYSTLKAEAKSNKTHNGEQNSFKSFRRTNKIKSRFIQSSNKIIGNKTKLLI